MTWLFFRAFLLYFTTGVNIKLLRDDKENLVKDLCVFFLIGGLSAIPNLLANVSNLYVDILAIGLLLAYFKWTTRAPILRLLLELTTSINIITIIEYLSNKLAWYHTAIFFVGVISLSVLSAYLIAQGIQKIGKEILAFNENLQLLLYILSLFLFFLFHQAVHSQIYGHTEVRLPIWLFIVFVALIVGTVIVYLSTLGSKYEVKRLENEQEMLHYYLQNIEKAYRDIRKFKHDSQNILISLNGYLQEGRYEEMRTFLDEKSFKDFERTLEAAPVFPDMGNIKELTVRSLFISKFHLAALKNIPVHFEAKEEIAHVSIPSLDLVRMLGIVLDNAIEELEEAGKGELKVLVYRMDEGFTFLVKNHCRDLSFTIGELQRHGFSTKGENRGLGLGNLFEIAEKAKNVSVQTNVKQNCFIQKIVIDA